MATKVYRKKMLYKKRQRIAFKIHTYLSQGKEAIHGGVPKYWLYEKRRKKKMISSIVGFRGLCLTCILSCLNYAAPQCRLSDWLTLCRLTESSVLLFNCLQFFYGTQVRAIGTKRRAIGHLPEVKNTSKNDKFERAIKSNYSKRMPNLRI